jgi:hypothetical protein
MTQLDDWRSACSAQLDWQIPRVLWYQSYYDGEPAIIAMLDTMERQTFRRFLDESQANWCELVVNATAERLKVVGFRFAESSDQAWLIWQANCMDSDSELVQTDALISGGSYALVQPDESNPTGVSITAESPLEATVLYAPGNRRERAAGYKRFLDPVSRQATDVVMLPDVIATWPPNAQEPIIAPNPAGVVTMVEVVPQPRTYGPHRSELDSAIPIQDRIHTSIFNRMVGMDYGAFRQIWATGVRLAREVVTNEDGSETITVRRPYDIGANRLLTNEDPSGKFGAFPGDPLSGYLSAVDQDIEAMSAITQTPAYYLTHGKLVNLAADAIKALDAGLVAKVTRRALHIGEAWETVMRLALGLIGDPGATDVQAEVIWADFESRSQAQLTDALVKMATLGVPREILWQRWGATPQEVAEWKAMNEANPPPPVPAAAVPGAPVEPVPAEPATSEG